MARPVADRSPAPPPAVRAAALFVLGALVLSLLLMAAAMALYPGGTWLDRASPGHDFLRNFFCDLTADRALNGQTNPGASFAKAGMVLLSAGTLPFWFLVTRLFSERARLGLAVRGLGLASALAAIAVPLAPSQRYGLLHAGLIFVAGVPGLFAGGLATFGLVTTNHGSRTPARLAGLTAGLAALDGALYAAHVASGVEITSALLPALQKLAALALVAWMAGTATLAGFRD
ncbi:hypothetical protein [Polyangium fumosum]|uniref:DUF998 domain-containing protein n=1 Tax=Polyangium fumosum TaxID=889272 RepID=A0A4U1JG08_9BACT|nr:hypothetical protein [Polyangium fumosum]TKD10195.1 hypothetical protein E8A74_09275 [Polyangium fumosum]